MRLGQGWAAGSQAWASSSSSPSWLLASSGVLWSCLGHQAGSRLGGATPTGSLKPPRPSLALGNELSKLLSYEGQGSGRTSSEAWVQSQAERLSHG